jgi:hypothetical protein
MVEPVLQPTASSNFPGTFARAGFSVSSSEGRHEHVLENRALRQQMMELKDETDGFVSEC